MLIHNRRSLIRGGAALSLAASFGAARFALADTKAAVRLIVPYPPGAATDTLGRLMAQALEPAVAAPVIVDNRGGAGTQIGTRAVATAAPDGRTLGFVDTAFVINPGLFGSALPYDTEKDFAPISLMASAPLVLIVHRATPAATLKEFVALSKAKPGSLNYGSAGVGSAPHLAGEQLRTAAAIDINHVPYRGGGTVLNDLLAGHVQFGFTTVPTMIDHIRAGTVRALAVTGGQRATQLPDTPTMQEVGLPSVDATPIFGLIGPAKLAPDTVSRLSSTAAQAVRAGPLHQKLIELGFVPVGSTAGEFRTRIRQEIEKWGAVVKAGNIKPNA
ncbi:MULTISPECIES: tripartite tricarboxylate transporter substrate binding protein [Variovorax]|uniref:tripartite tricarboxylate transporter substrate binding protein n=1 Tax=Variovorax TaxID=34072 RepID=UPI00285AD0B2|nr:tripartite tricarboxylate transporter substrate binding protein [Variovorax sp. 3319]MDR6890779.1 tripartite-type tricarboxylate transporter receptor subunit TctC [Variovorax sp. 3319]